MLLDMKSNFGRSRTPTVIQYMSDLHLERLDYQYTLTPAAPNLLLAGDIGRLSDTAKYRSFLTHCSTQFTKILLVAGNHEYYGTSHSQGHQLLNSITNDPATQGKILFLHRATYDVPDTDITIAGCTLHSRIDDRTSLTNDFKRIREWSVDQHNAEHGADMAWLKSTLAQVGEGRRVIVATHYAPEVEGSCHPMYRGSKLNQCFASDALRGGRWWLVISGVVMLVSSVGGGG
ncbi:hypothetical protein MBLNU457_g2833t1 [Dothideomycetes sp. NU457]